MNQMMKVLDKWSIHTRRPNSKTHRLIMIFPYRDQMDDWFMCNHISNQFICKVSGHFEIWEGGY